MMLVDHTQTSQGFSGDLLVGVWDAKASGEDELEFHVSIAGTHSHKDHYVTPTGAPGVVLPVDVLWCVHNSDVFQAE